MKKIAILSIVFFSLTYISCKVDEIDTFGQDDYVYFPFLTDAQNEEEQDENGLMRREFTFALETDQALTQKEFSVLVNIAGTTKPVDRYISYQVIDSLTTAVEGTHYELLPETASVIPANSAQGVFSLKALKTPEMDSEIFRLAIKIVDNQDLKAGATSGTIISLSNIFDKPIWWRSWLGLGEFTQTKGRLWFEFMGVTDGSNPWDVEPYIAWVDYGSGTLQRVDNVPARHESIRLFALWLAEGDENGDPYIDENGELVLDTF